MPPRKKLPPEVEIAKLVEENKWLKEKIVEATKPKPSFLTPIKNRLKNTCWDEAFIGFGLGMLTFYLLLRYAYLKCPTLPL